MYDHQVFASGVYGTLIVNWTLHCETPLAIRNGLKATYQMRDNQKSRGVGTHFYWRAPDKTKFKNDCEVTALYYGYEVRNGSLSIYYFIPPSSLRGALRSWTINHLVENAYRSKMSPPAKQDTAGTEKYLAAVRQALTESKSGYQWVASIFGLAFDTRTGGEDLSNAGRLHIATERFNQHPPQKIEINGDLEDGLAGPLNARRQMTVRNPLDRITHASRDGGLHHFLEFCKGEDFKVHLTILNPRPSDLGLISLWRRELNDGLLRLGALSSIGRGRVSVKEDEDSYQLWLGPGAPADDQWLGAQEQLAQSDDALSGLWKTFTLPASQLDQYEKTLQEEA